jgi:hypothetical protein
MYWDHRVRDNDCYDRSCAMNVIRHVDYAVCLSHLPRRCLQPDHGFLLGKAISATVLFVVLLDSGRSPQH